MSKDANGTSVPNTKTGYLESEILRDVPIQARSLTKLSTRELSRYRKARALLASGGGVRTLLRANITLAGLGIYESLLTQSWLVRFDDPQEMVCLAEAAVEVSGRFAGKAYSEKRTADLQARAWGELANAFRVTDRLRSAQLAFGQAYTFLHSGTGDSLLKARLFDLEASLLGVLREFPLALHRLDSLSNLYLELGETFLAGRTLITRALYLYYSGEPREAVQINQKGINLINRRRDHTLFLHALHNHLLFLVDLRRYGPARRMLFESRQYLIYQDRVSATRLRWIEGRICYGLSELVSAEIGFREVKESFASMGMHFHSALLALELAMVLRSRNRIEEALEEIIVAREIFLSFEIYREYLGSVVFLEDSLRRGDATAKLIEDTIAQIIRKSLQIGPRQMR